MCVISHRPFGWYMGVDSLLGARDLVLRMASPSQAEEGGAGGQDTVAMEVATVSAEEEEEDEEGGASGQVII